MKHSRSKIAALIALASASAARASTFNNPIAANGADPWVVLYNGTYYYTETTGGNVALASSATLPGIGTAALNNVFSNSSYTNVWAPELHNGNDGHWYIYFSATVGSTDHRMYVLQSANSSPTSLYSLKGQLNDPTNLWAIDGTTYTAPSGNMYFIWSGWPGTTNVTQNLYIAPMSNPYTVSGNRTLISSPTNSWETVGAPPSINEGPEILTSPSGKTTLIYSASGSWTDSYALGQLTLTGSDPTLASSWTKQNSSPVFASANNVFGPGHASFTTSDNSTRNWIVYHAAKTQGSGWDRNIRTQPFSYNPDGTPSFGQPVPVTVPIQWGPTTWLAAINGSNNDTVHDYNNSSNWLNGTITDSFANITITDNTTLYLSADRTTTGDVTLTYGSGQKFFSLQSNNAASRTLTLNGNIVENVLGGANNVFISTAARPITLALGSTTRTFNIDTDDSLYIDGPITAAAGFTVSGGGTVVLRGSKSYSGTTVISSGTLSAGDGSSPSTAANLSSSSSISLSSTGTLKLVGLNGATNGETIAGLSGFGGTVTNGLNAERLTIANPTPGQFFGNITGTNLSLTVAGPGSQTLAGNANTYTGDTTITGGSLTLSGAFTGTSNLFVRGGLATIAANGSLTSSGFSSVGLNAGETGNLSVSGSLTVNNDFNIGDNGNGNLTILSGASITTKTLYVAKFGSSSATVTQSGGSVTSLAGGSDWRIGGTNSAAAASVGNYNISGGILNSGVYNFQIGANGHGTMTQTGGAVSSGGYFSIGRYIGGVGSYSISAGTLTAITQPYLIVGEQGTGTLNVSGNGAVSAASLSIGHTGGAGSVVQTGGSVVASTSVVLGMSTGGTGSYLLSGGSLTTPLITRGSGSGTFTFDGGTLTAGIGASSLFQSLSTVAIRTGGAMINTNGLSVSIAPILVHDSSIAGADGGLTKSGAGTLTINGVETYNGDTSVAGGSLNFSANSGSGVVTRPVGSLSISSGAQMNALAGSGHTLLVARGLSIPGLLDLNNADMIMQAGDISSITAALTSGLSQTGTGITSSSALTNPSHLTTIGSVLATANSTFDTFSVSPGDVLLKYTYYGDADLSGTINGNDYTQIDNGFNMAGSLTGWENGDFNYDGFIDGSDYSLIDNAFNVQSTSFTATTANMVATPTAEIGNSVPEPSQLMFFGAITILLKRRRCRV